MDPEWIVHPLVTRAQAAYRIGYLAHFTGYAAVEELKAQSTRKIPFVHPSIHYVPRSTEEHREDLRNALLALDESYHACHELYLQSQSEQSLPSSFFTGRIENLQMWMKGLEEKIKMHGITP